MFATVPPPPQRLLVFARLPELGRVKTRLAADIGEARALAVYEAMLRDLIESIGDSTPDLEIELLWPPTPAANGAALRRAFRHHAVAMQTGADLSDRLAMAFSERFFFHRTETIIAIGADDPRLSRELLDHAFALLDTCEWVIGPAADGGYYLIGCRAAAYKTAIFTDVAWGTDAVLKTTLDRIRDWGSSVALLPKRSDIDVIEDLRRFEGDGAVGALLHEWGWREVAAS